MTKHKSMAEFMYHNFSQHSAIQPCPKKDCSTRYVGHTKSNRPIRSLQILRIACKNNVPLNIVYLYHHSKIGETLVPPFPPYIEVNLFSLIFQTCFSSGDMPLTTSFAISSKSSMKSFSNSIRLLFSSGEDLECLSLFSMYWS